MVVNPYSKEELDAFFAAKQDSSGAFKYVVDDENHTGIDNPEFDTIYLSKLFSGAYDYAKVFAVKVPGVQIIWEYAFYAYSGKMQQRTRTNGVWGSWLPIGISDNINSGAIITDHIHNGAVTLPKLGSDVFESVDINTIVDDGSETDTVVGIAQCFGDFCMMEVSIHFKRQVTYNSFTLPFAPSQHICKDFSWWTNAASSSATAYIVFVSASDNKCYIRRQDNGNLTGNVSFSVMYRRSVGS